MAFTALGCWTLARILLCQLLKLPFDMSSPLNLLVPELTSVFHGWLIGPLLAQQVLPPPVAAYLLTKTAASSKRSNFSRWSIAAAAFAILIGAGIYLSQQGAKGVALLLWILPYPLAFGVGILLWVVLAMRSEEH